MRDIEKHDSKTEEQRIANEVVFGKSGGSRRLPIWALHFYNQVRRSQPCHLRKRMQVFAEEVDVLASL